MDKVIARTIEDDEGFIGKNKFKLVKLKSNECILEYEIDDERSKVDALIEESKRIYEQEHKQDYYRLCLLDDDISEIYELR